MADTQAKIIQAEPEYIPERSVTERTSLWPRLALGGIMLISIFMNFFELGKNGFGSYYPPAVRSMMDNWHNFFFASYDPGGFVTVDKPPVGFWFQVLSSKIFGFSPFSVLFPQALAGVLSVLLLYYLVRRHFGVVAGLLAALALALSPLSIITNRNVTIDSTLALTLLIGAWTVLRAAETGKLRWLLLTAVIVGIGFNIKMLESYLVVPAFGLLYLLAAPRTLWTRVWHLLLAVLVLVVVSFSWIAIVDSIPASQRPYVGSTQDNSELSLALGYNGIERLLGRFGGRGGFGGGNAPTRPSNTGTNSGSTSGNGSSNSGNFPGNGNGTRSGGTNAQRNVPNGGFGGIFDTSNPGPTRLFTLDLGGQIAWLLPIALLSILALAWQGRPRFQTDYKQKSLLLWGAWLLTMGIFFSVAGFFHQYYMTVMAPSIAALFGIGVVTMWKDYQAGGWRAWLLPIALVATAAEQIYLVSFYPTWSRIFVPIIVVLSLVALIALVGRLIAARTRLRVPGNRLVLTALAAGLLALFVAPTAWAAIPIVQSRQADQLTAGPVQQDGFGGGFGGGRNDTANSNTKLIQYLEANQGNTKYLVAVPSSMVGDALIIATNKPVMALGGFSGSDPILTTSQLATLVSNGTVRFFLLNGPISLQQLPPQILDQIPQQFRNAARNGGFGGFGQQSTLTTWVSNHCSKVPTSQWQTSSSSTSTTANGGFRRGGATALYDCATTH